MINKQNLWFLTLFSLILVLSVYYITMPNELLLTNNSAIINGENDKTMGGDDTVEEVTVSVQESEILVALRVNLDEERQEIKADLESLLTNSSITSEEKNNAYTELKQLTEISGKETKLEKKIRDTYKLPVFIKIDGNEITVVVDNDKHDTKLANNIMRSVQEEFKEKMYITIQFK